MLLRLLFIWTSSKSIFYNWRRSCSACHVTNCNSVSANGDDGQNMMMAVEGGSVSMKPSEKEGTYAMAWAQNI